MTARKKSIRRTSKNVYGYPLVLAREDIGMVFVKGNEYNEVHVCAGMHGIAIVLYTHYPHKDRPNAFETQTSWDAWDWHSRPVDASSLSEQVERLIVAVKEQAARRDALNFMPTDFPSVLV